MKLGNNAEYNRVKDFLKTVKVADEWATKYLLKSVASNLPEVNTMKEVMLARFEDPNVTKWSVTMEHREDELQFGISVCFDSREEMLKFVEKFALTLPEKVIKSGHVDSDMKATTNMIYAWEQDGYKFNLSYTRDGFPTKHCKVVKNTDYAVACDINGNDDNE